MSDIPSDGTEHEPAPEPLDEQPLTTPPPPPEGVTHVTNDVQSIVATPPDMSTRVSAEAVSYTHLDVYKRQGLFWPLFVSNGLTLHNVHYRR